MHSTSAMCRPSEPVHTSPLHSVSSAWSSARAREHWCAIPSAIRTDRLHDGTGSCSAYHGALRDWCGAFMLRSMLRMLIRQTRASLRGTRMLLGVCDRSSTLSLASGTWRSILSRRRWFRKSIGMSSWVISRSSDRRESLERYMHSL